MTVLHIIGGISRASGGPARSSQGLVAGLRAAGVDAWLMTLNLSEKPWVKGVDKFINGGTFAAALEEARPDIVHIHGIWDWGLHRCAAECRRRKIPYVIAPRGMLEPWSLKTKWLKKRVARWLYQDRDLKKAAALHATAECEAEQFRKLGLKNPVIVSPNGVNVPEGEEERRLRDEVDNGRIGLGSCRNHELHGLNELGEDERRLRDEVGVDNGRIGLGSCRNHELHGLNELGEGRGVGVKSLSGRMDDSSLNLQPQPKRALFVSRMHPKKGVLELVEAWARVFKSEKREVRGEKWQCELVYTLNGETERAYEAKVKQRILDLGLSYKDKDGTFHSSEAVAKPGRDGVPPPSAAGDGTPALPTATSNCNFILTGPLSDDEKWSAYARADLFVLPTYSENFGIVVAEALYAGLPVITTKGTPWSDLETFGCGMWVDVGVEALTGALAEMLQKSDDERKRMGENGRRLVEEKYLWSAVVNAMVAGYREVEGS